MRNSFEQEQVAPEIHSIPMLVENMVYRLPGADDVEVRKALLSAYRDFCRLSSCYTHRFEIELERGECEYPVPALVSETFVDSITEVRLDGRKLVSPRDYTIAVGTTNVILLAHHLVPDKSADPRFCGKLVVTSIDQPKHGSEKAPRWFFDKYGEAVVAGALAKMFSQTGKAWSDAAQAQQEQIRFENFLTETRLRTVYAGDGASGSGEISALDTSTLL